MNDGLDARSFHILLVEDNAADVYLFRQALKGAGLNFILTVIEDGAEAIAFARRCGNHAGSPVPDLAVIDLNLPKIGGAEVLDALRRTGGMSNVPVAVMTFSATSQDQAKCEALGVVLFITKPLYLEDFLQIGGVLRQVLLESEQSHSRNVNSGAYRRLFRSASSRFPSHRQKYAQRQHDPKCTPASTSRAAAANRM